ncbi:MAG TPA: class I SAM-dependent methyltransferase [Pirellulales bacterium]|nr:class I SAM-dependent methyltransferase [Pirellulales bacterium]
MNCYSAVDRLFPGCGLFDLTDGIYQGNPETPYELAQANQHYYLLDQALCGPGSRLLDIGCGYGTLLERVCERGAVGTGITISPEQAAFCRNGHLNVLLLDYRALPDQWDASFDCVIANGSIEHFVRPEDVAAGGADDIYRGLFASVHRLIDPHSVSRRFVTTTIHVVREPRDPLALRHNPLKFRWGSDDFHWSVLEAGWGGYYPSMGQLQRCADGYFELIEEVDGTDDYRLTSEEWLRRVRRAFRSWQAVNSAGRLLPVFARAPRQTLALLFAIFVSESWNWQFRPPEPPTRLLRQTWAYREAPPSGIHGRPRAQPKES